MRHFQSFYEDSLPRKILPRENYMNYSHTLSSRLRRENNGKRQCHECQHVKTVVNKIKFWKYDLQDSQDSLFPMSQTHNFPFCLSWKFNFYFHFSRKFHLRFFFHPLLKVIFLQLCNTELRTSAALIELWKYFEGLPFPPLARVSRWVLSVLESLYFAWLVKWKTKKF